ncbi:peptidoglycan-binding protein [Nocardioides daejeonensis]|uniref:peptidoglycan-binding protein n=1 Tax=Nocardioides daejeonensis TaxID=1046556 RepID=UPI000D74CF05|nr:peptidoglycan-binding protein [Nocardioides daejeonensis]
MRRYRALALMVVGALLCAILGYAVALAMAPAREGGTPRPSGPVTAEVERRTLTSAVIVRGDAGFSDPVELVVRATAPIPVVTRIAKRRGDTVHAGEVFLEVAGRPVITLPGALPSYRDLGPGDVGPDVRQLERALDALGLDPGEVDDEFTAATGTAVERLYERLGYPAPPKRGALPMSEVAYVPTLPRRVDRMPARLGQPLPEAPLLLSGSHLVVTVGLTTADLKVLKAGMRAEIDVPGGARIRGRLGAVTSTDTGGRTTVRLARLSEARQRRLRGANVKVTVPLRKTRGRVLVVPLAALSTDASGTVRVIRLGAGGATEAIRVATGLSAQGYAEIQAEGLAEGDRVVVGS